MTEHEHALELMPGYALGNLSAEESRLVERHTAACPACAQTLQQYRATVGELPEAIVYYDPPPDLKARILSRAAAAPAAAARPAQPAWRRLVNAFPRLSPAWGLAGLALIALLALSNALLWTRANRMQNTSALRTVALHGDIGAPHAQGTLVISLDGQHGTLVVDGLPPLDAARQYQLWLMRDGRRDTGGVFSVSPEGYGALWIDSPAPLAGYQSVGVTIEPRGGSPAPTGAKVLGGDL